MPALYPFVAAWALAALGAALLATFALDWLGKHHDARPAPRIIIAGAIATLVCLVASLCNLALAQAMSPAALALCVLALQANSATATYILWGVKKLACNVNNVSETLKRRWKVGLVALRLCFTSVFLVVLALALLDLAARAWLLPLLAADSLVLSALLVRATSEVVRVIDGIYLPSVSVEPATPSTPSSLARASNASARSNGGVAWDRVAPFYRRVKRFRTLTICLAPFVTLGILAVCGVLFYLGELPFQFVWMTILLASLYVVIVAQWLYATRVDLGLVLRAPRASFTMLLKKSQVWRTNSTSLAVQQPS